MYAVEAQFDVVFLYLLVDFASAASGFVEVFGVSDIFFSNSLPPRKKAGIDPDAYGKDKAKSLDSLIKAGTPRVVLIVFVG